MKKTVYSANPKPFIKNGSFVRVHEDGNISSWGVVVDDRIVYQDGGFDTVKSVLPEKVIPEIRINYYIEAVVNAPYGFDDLDKEVFDWEYREVKPMPKLETGMFVFVEYNRDKYLGGLGVVVGNDIIYQKGGWDKVFSFDKNGEGEKHNCKITAVAYGEYIKNFNSAETLINNGTPNGTPMEDSKRNLWKAQD